MSQGTQTCESDWFQREEDILLDKGYLKINIQITYGHDYTRRVFVIYLHFYHAHINISIVHF